MIKLKIVSEYGQEIPQSQTADKPMAPRGRATQQPRDKCYGLPQQKYVIDNHKSPDL